MPKLSQAVIKSVKRHTQLDHYAPHQYRLRYWDAGVQAWREGQITNRETALRGQFETRVRLALEKLGFEPDEAGEIAWRASYNDYGLNTLDWRQYVRYQLRKHPATT